MKINKIYAVWVYVNDLAKSRNFYENILGLKFKFQQENWIEFNLGQASFAILERPKDKKPLKPQKTRIMFQVEDLIKFKNHLLKNKVKRISNIRHEGYGKLLTFEDPNGH